MGTRDYDNPLVAGFGTATAEAPPLPAQQHLDATDGEKVAPVVSTQEYGSGKIHQVASDGEHVGSGAAGADEDDYDSPEDAVAERAYNARGVTVDHLKAEIDARNEERDEDSQISKDGKKADLIAALQADDTANDAE